MGRSRFRKLREYYLYKQGKLTVKKQPRPSSTGTIEIPQDLHPRKKRKLMLREKGLL